MGGFVPAALGQSWDNSCHPHANPWCHGLRPSSHLPPPAPGLEMLTALLFIRAVPAVIGAITEAVQGQAGSSAAVALLCPAGLLPSRWAVGHSVSTTLCQAPHSVPQAAPHTQGMDSLCPLRVLARTVDPRASRAVGELAQNTKANQPPRGPSTIPAATALTWQAAVPEDDVIECQHCPTCGRLCQGKGELQREVRAG